MKKSIFQSNHYLIKTSYTNKSSNSLLKLSKSQDALLDSKKINTMKSEIENQLSTECDDFSALLKSTSDRQLKKFNYKCSYPQHIRLEKIQEFVYQKKLQNICKYTDKKREMKNNSQAIPQGTCSILINQHKPKNGAFNLSVLDKKISQKSKYKMKWRTIQWLQEFKKDAINQLFKNYQYIVKIVKLKTKGLKKDEFLELMLSIGLGTDQSLIDKLFYVFDEDQNGIIDYKELIIGLEVFREDSLEDKIQVFFDLCDADGNGTISKKELYDLLKRNIVAFYDRIKLKRTINQIFNECDQNGDGVLDKKEILQASKSNSGFRQLLQQGINDIKSIDKLIENDLKEPFNQFIPASSNFINCKEGIFYPYNDTLINAIGEMQQIRDQNESYLQQL